jgi:hypothetical protein
VVLRREVKKERACQAKLRIGRSKADGDCGSGAQIKRAVEKEKKIKWARLSGLLMIGDITQKSLGARYIHKDGISA